MKAFPLRIFSAVFLLALFTGCANIVPPTGGKKDTTPPKLVSISPGDSLLNTHVTQITMRFDEFIALDNATKEIQISPVMPFPLATVLSGKKLTVNIPDSLLKDSTTYRISFGSAIKDINEGNAFKNMNYIFSTGDFFDSLMIAGTAYDAVTGKPAGSDINIVLYDARRPDSAIVREKPEYVTKVKSKGHFILPGLPGKSFRIYALKDDNDNLVYDGANEQIAFIDSIIFPLDTIGKPLELRLFKEIAPLDTAKDADSVITNTRGKLGKRKGIAADSKDFRYSVGVDTSNKDKRTHDLNKPVKITFSSQVDTYDVDRISLSLDSSENLIPFTITRDTLPDVLFLNAEWKENTLYTIKLLKDFAQDSTGLKATPSKHMFRTKGDEDYGILVINVPSVYKGNKYRLVVTTDKDTCYNKPVTDTLVQIKRLLPEKYHFSIIVDENENGIWDTGNLFEKIQPELVIPHTDVIDLKAGWEIVVDFVMPVTEGETAKKKEGAPPVRGDRPGAK